VGQFTERTGFSVCVVLENSYKSRHIRSSKHTDLTEGGYVNLSRGTTNPHIGELFYNSLRDKGFYHIISLAM